MSKSARLTVRVCAMQDWIQKLLSDVDLAGMGHNQAPEENNLGLGWIYYGLVRALRPKIAVVIGSYRGFVPLVLGKAMHDNGEGKVIFIDPSLVDDFWTYPQRVTEHFASYGVTNVDHHLATTEQFVQTATYQTMDQVGLLYVDGYHTAEHAKFDHEAFLPKMAPSGVTLFHDSVRERLTRIYGDDAAYRHTVYRYMAELRNDSRYEVITLPEGDGLTLVKVAP